MTRGKGPEACLWLNEHRLYFTSDRSESSGHFYWKDQKFKELCIPTFIHLSTQARVLSSSHMPSLRITVETQHQGLIGPCESDSVYHAVLLWTVIQFFGVALLLFFSFGAYGMPR